MSGAEFFLRRSLVAIRRAAFLLKEGKIVAFPTETVYGLGACVWNEKAVCRIFEVKKRPSFDPLIVHVWSLDQALSLWKEVPADARRLMERFWPGPLSIVLPKNKRVPDVVTAGLATVAVRMPAHRMALRLIREAGSPIAAPSANLFGRTSPTTAQDVMEDMGGRIDAVLDGGPCRVGVESTVVKFEKGRCTLLRPGGVAAELIEKVLKKKVYPVKADGEDNKGVKSCLGYKYKKCPKELVVKEGFDPLHSPGMLESHYAPRASMVLLKPGELQKMDPVYFKSRKIAVLSFKKISKKTFYFHRVALSSRGDLYQAASRLFQAIRKLDKMNPDLIVAEPVPARGIGLAIMDRLKKAASSRVGLEAIKKIPEK